MGGQTFDDVARGICVAPPGLSNPGFKSLVLKRMQDLVARGDLSTRVLLWDDVGESFRRGGPPPRAMLEGGRDFESDEQRLYYLRYLLQMELEGDTVRGNPSGSAKNAFRIASAMADYELRRLGRVADEVAPLPQPQLGTPVPRPGRDNPSDARGIAMQWGRMAAAQDRADYEGYLAEVALLQAYPPEPEPERTQVFSGASSTWNPYDYYIGGPFKSMVSRAVDTVPVVVSLTLDFVPVVGQLKAVLEAVAGKDYITGRELAPWERGLGALLAVLPEARGIFKAGRDGYRALAGAALKRGIAAEDAYRVAREASKLSEAEVNAAKEIVNGKPAHPREFEKVAGSIDEMVGAKPKGARAQGFRAVAGVIEDGRGLSRSVTSSPLDAARRVVPGKVVKAVKTPERIASMVADKLHGVGPEALASLERAGVKLTEDSAIRLLNDLHATVFVRDFHQCPGFEVVLKDFLQAGEKSRGAEFLMEFVTTERIDPRLAMFEVPAGITKVRTAKQTRDVVSRLTDLVVTEGNRTVSYEFKAYSRESVALLFENPKKVIQLVKDVKMLGRENIRWVFDSRKVTREFVYKQFERAIKSDAVLAREFGDSAKLEKALDDLVVMFPPVPKRVGIPASAVPKAAGQASGSDKK